MSRNGTNSGILLMAATAFLWSTAGLFIKAIDWNPIAIAGMRSFIASIVIFIYLRKPRFHFSFPQIAAAAANAVTMILFITANKTTTAANAILLQYLAPVFTAVTGSVILKEKTSPVHWFSFLFAAAGMTIMFSGKIDSGERLGNMLAIASGFTFSLYFIFMRMQKEGSPVESILLSHWITAAVSLCASFFLPVPQFTAKSAGAILMLGIVQIGFSSILFSFAIKKITAVSANLIAVIEPVFNPVWVFIILGEYPGTNTVTGGMVIVLAVTAVSVFGKEKPLPVLTLPHSVSGIDDDIEQQQI